MGGRTWKYCPASGPVFKFGGFFRSDTSRYVSSQHSYGVYLLLLPSNSAKPNGALSFLEEVTAAVKRIRFSNFNSGKVKLRAVPRFDTALLRFCDESGEESYIFFTKIATMMVLGRNEPISCIISLKDGVEYGGVFCRVRVRLSILSLPPVASAVRCLLAIK